jgi:hypothetical protein
MKETLLLVALMGLFSIVAFAACSPYARCPYDGETAALVESHNDGNGSWVATHAHTHKDDRGQTYHHEFTKTCD